MNIRKHDHYLHRALSEIAGSAIRSAWDRQELCYEIWGHVICRFFDQPTRIHKTSYAYGGTRTAPKFCMFHKRDCLPLPPVEHTKLRSYTSVDIPN